MPALVSLPARAGHRHMLIEVSWFLSDDPAKPIQIQATDDAGSVWPLVTIDRAGSGEIRFGKQGTAGMSIGMPGEAITIAMANPGKGVDRSLRVVHSTAAA